MNRILNISHKTTIKNCTAVLLVSLPEAWVLVQLGQDFVECWDVRSMDFNMGWLGLRHLLLIKCA